MKEEKCEHCFEGIIRTQKDGTKIKCKWCNGTGNQMGYLYEAERRRRR